MNKKQARDAVMKVLSDYGLDSSAVWDCHGTTVILHRALEHIASKAGIVFERPSVVESASKVGIVAIWVGGKLKDREEWSFGEASPKNNKTAYPYAMAEKRAKDRVILKLIGLAGYVYSEEEADEFRESAPDRKPAPASGKPLSVQTDARDRLDWSDVLGERPLDIVTRNAAQSRQPFAELNKDLRTKATVEDLMEWADTRAPVIWSLADEARHHLRESFDTHLAHLETERAAA